MQFIDIYKYIELVKKAQNIICVKDYKKHNRGLILRHDVDESLDFAYELYQIEKENKVKSTFYILLTSDLYNPFSLKNRTRLKEMVESGFEIGLHFDPMAYSNNQMLKNFKQEMEMFEKYLNIKLYSYSMHNPSITGEYIKYPNLIDAYSSDIFNNECYISDSTFSFRGKDLKEYIEKSNNQLIQLLIHADHLMSEGEISYRKPIEKMLKNYLKKIDDTYFVNSIYQKEREEILKLIG
jgi:hypothetical protein